MKNQLSAIDQLTKPFLHRLVIMKATGISIEGSLWRVDSNSKHNPPGLGNLILSNKTIIKGNQVQCICVDRREKT